MDYILGSRGTGKSKQLLYLAQRNNGVVVSANPRAMEQKAKDYNMDTSGMEFAGYHALITPEALGDRKIYIDELEAFLKYINPNIAGYNASLE